MRFKSNSNFNNLCVELPKTVHKSRFRIGTGIEQNSSHKSESLKYLKQKLIKRRTHK